MNHTPSATLSAVTRSVAVAHGGRRLYAGRGIRLDVAHGQVQYRVTAQVLADAHRELDAAEIPVVRKGDQRWGVAHDRVGLHRLDLLHQPGRVDKGGGAKTPGYGERYRRQRASAFGSRAGGGAVGKCRLDDAMRRGPQVVDAAVHGDRRSAGIGTGKIPGDIAAQQPAGTLLTGAHEWHGTSARGFGAAACGIFAEGRVVVVGHARKARIGDLRPRHAWLESLSERGSGAASRKRNAVQGGAAHRKIGTPQYRVGAFRRYAGTRHQAGQGEQGHGPSRANTKLNRLHSKLLFLRW